MSAQPETDLLTQVKQRVLDLIQAMFKIEDATIARCKDDANLFNQLGIDSLQAFDAVVTLHEIIREEVPRDVDPTAIASLNGIAGYLISQYPAERLNRLFEGDFAEILAERAGAVDAL